MNEPLCGSFFYIEFVLENIGISSSLLVVGFFFLRQRQVAKTWSGHLSDYLKNRKEVAAMKDDFKELLKLLKITLLCLLLCLIGLLMK